MAKTSTDQLDNVTLYKTIREKMHQGQYRMSAHAIDRQSKREVDMRDIVYVLKRGTHEEDKTGFDIRHQTWKYAIRGKAVGGCELRIIVAISDAVIVITAINLSKRRT